MSIVIGTGVLFLILSLVFGFGFFFMSIVPLDLDRYKEWTMDQMYYELFPRMKEDFMGKLDCQAIHAEGNMLPVVSGATGSITHIIRGGSDNLTSAKEAQYRAYVEQGSSTLSTAQDTGETTGFNV